MINLYSWPTPNGHKIHIALEELKLDYKAHAINIGAGEQFDKNFLKISPNNRIPAIVDTNGPNNKSIGIFESGAILIYLAEKTGKLLSRNPTSRYATIQWLMWQMGGIGPMFGQSNHFSYYAPRKIQYAINRYNNECLRLYGVMEKRLDNSKFLGGNNFSIADIATFPWANGHRRRNIDISKFPSVSRWLNKMNNRSAVNRGLKVLTEHRVENKPFTKKEKEILFGKTQYQKH